MRSWFRARWRRSILHGPLPSRLVVVRGPLRVAVAFRGAMSMRRRPIVAFVVTSGVIMTGRLTWTRSMLAIGPVMRLPPLLSVMWAARHRVEAACEMMRATVRGIVFFSVMPVCPAGMVLAAA